MTYLTPPEAAKHKCPIARTFDDGGGRDPKSAGCDGPGCILWRWRELSVMDNRVLGAYKRVAMDMMTAEREKDPDTKKTEGSFHKAAVAKVAAAPWDFIFMTDEDRGYCGLGGQP